MLEETGLVVRSTPAGVWVETVRQSSCGSCAARKGCGQRLLAEVGQGRRFEVRADNPRRLELRSGDRVVLGLAENALLMASAMVYLVPLALMLLLAVLAQQAAVAEPWVVAAGVAGLGLGFLLARWFGRHAASGCRLHPEIIRFDR